MNRYIALDHLDPTAAPILGDTADAVRIRAANAAEGHLGLHRRDLYALVPVPDFGDGIGADLAAHRTTFAGQAGGRWTVEIRIGAGPGLAALVVTQLGDVQVGATLTTDEAEALGVALLRVAADSRTIQPARVHLCAAIGVTGDPHRFVLDDELADGDDWETCEQPEDHPVHLVDAPQVY